MKRYLKIVTLCILVLGLIAMIGCGQKATTGGDQPAGQASTEVKTYKVGTDAAYAPFESVDPSGKIVGFDMDVLSAIADAAGFKVEFVNTNWDGIFASLTQNKNDMLISAISITPDRQKEMDFSNEYWESTNYIAVPENSPIKTLDDLKGKKVSVQLETTGDLALTKFLGKDYKDIKRFKGTPEAFLELRNGNVDAAVADSGVVMFYVKNNPEAKLRIIKDAKFEKEFYGIAVKKGNTELVTKINEGLKKIKENGKFNEIYQNWFGAAK